MARGTVKRITTDKRKRTRWEARFAGYDRNGDRRQFRRRFDTRREAEAWLSDLESRHYTDGISISPAMTLGEYAEVWHQRMQHQWAPSTYHHRLSNWRRNIAPYLEGRRIADITRADCQRVVDALIDKGQKPNSIHVAIAHLSMVLRAAVDDEVIPRNVATGLTLPRVRREVPVTWTAEQVRCFLRGTAGTQVGVIGHLLLTTGARIGEALALTWDALDLDAGTMRIIATLQRADGGTDIAPATKTESSRRVVPLTSGLIAALRDHRDAQAAVLAARGVHNRRNLVFPSPTGDRLHPSTFSYQLRTRIEALALPAITPHQMRHTAATLLMESGVPPKVVQEMLGHKTITMTLDTYSHVTLGMQRQAVATLDRLTASEDGEPPQIEG